MNADRPLSKLDGARSTGHHSWLARCPGHNDRHPSLSIRELPDGRVLVHDFAGCSVEDVLAAVGLEFDALYPPRAIDHRLPPERRPFSACDVLRASATEALVAAVVSADIIAGCLPDRRDHDRLVTASSRIRAAVEVDYEMFCVDYRGACIPDGYVGFAETIRQWPDASELHGSPLDGLSSAQLFLAWSFN
jgi:hypothetical protein